MEKIDNAEGFQNDFLNNPSHHRKLKAFSQELWTILVVLIAWIVNVLCQKLHVSFCFDIALFLFSEMTFALDLSAAWVRTSYGYVFWGCAYSRKNMF